MTTPHNMRRTRGEGTPVPHIRKEPPVPQPVNKYIASPEEIDAMLSKYPPHKLRLSKREPVYELHILPPKVGERA